MIQLQTNQFEDIKAQELSPEIQSILEKNLLRIIREGKRSILPPKKQLTSEWAEENRILPDSVAEPGPYRNVRAPHSVAIMNAADDPRVRQIVMMGSAQIGKTEIMNNIIGKRIDLDPCSIMIMFPTEPDAKDYALRKLDPMINDTPCLKKRVSKKKSRDSDNSIFRKKFPGGWLSVITANSASATRSKSVKLTIADDIDGIAINATNRREGNPLSRLIKRSTTFPDSLNILISTPTEEENSYILSAFEQTNKQYLYITCPHCGFKQKLIEENLYWEKELDMFGKPIKHFPETVRYRCGGPKCGVLLSESERLEALQNAEFIADRPHIIDKQGFFINEISSCLSTMKKVVDSILESGCDVHDGKIDTANADEQKLIALFNTVFGRAVKKNKGIEVDPLRLMDRREDYIDKDNIIIPEGVLKVTFMSDLQAGSEKGEGQRAEILVVGWGLGFENWILYHEKIFGNIKERVVWDRIDELRSLKWKRTDGIELLLEGSYHFPCGLIDSGWEAFTVYDYTTERESQGIFASKGANKYGADFLRRSTVNDGKTTLYTIGTQKVKEELMNNLKFVTAPGPKYTHFCKAFCDTEFFKQLTSEHAVRKNNEFYDYYVYEKKNRLDPNEILDMMVGNYTLIKACNPNFEAIKADIDAKKAAILANTKVEQPRPAANAHKPVYPPRFGGNFVTNY